MFFFSFLFLQIQKQRDMEKVVSILILTISTVCVIAFNLHNDNFEQDCPFPCTCVVFEGVPSVFCNGTGLKEVPMDIPTDTQFLDISNNSIQHIPKGVLTDLVHLARIDLRLNGFSDSSIDDDALDLPSLTNADVSLNNFTKIPRFLPHSTKVLFITFNMLTTLQDDSFSHVPQLQYLDIANNYLSSIESLAFTPLKSLETIFFLYNRLADNSFPPNVFSGNTNLKMVMFCFNQMQNMLPNLPESITMLGYVSNKLTHIPAYAFSSLPNLQNIEIWENQASHVYLIML